MNGTRIINSLRNLHDISKAINSSLDIEEVKDIIFERTAKLMLTSKERKKMNGHPETGARILDMLRR